MAKGTKSLHHGLAVDNNRNVYVKVLDGAPADATLGTTELVLFLDEASNELQVKLTYADGTVKAGTVATLT